MLVQFIRKRAEKIESKCVNVTLKFSILSNSRHKANATKLWHKIKMRIENETREIFKNHLFSCSI